MNTNKELNKTYEGVENMNLINDFVEINEKENSINSPEKENDFVKGAAWCVDEKTVIMKNAEPFGSYKETIETLRKKLQETARRIYTSNDPKIIQIVASTGLGKTYTVLNLIKENYDEFVKRSGENFKVLYISPYLNTNYQVELLVKELGLEKHVIVVSFQSIAHKIQHILKQKAEELSKSYDISVNNADYEYASVILKNNLYLENSYNRHTNLFKRYDLTLGDILPKKVIDVIKTDKDGNVLPNSHSRLIDTIIIDEIHDVGTIAQMEIGKGVESYRTMYGIYRDLLELLYEALHENLAFGELDHKYAKRLATHVRIKEYDPSKNNIVIEDKPIRVILLTATPPVHTLPYSKLLVIPKEFRHLDIDISYDLMDPKAIIDYDFERIEDYIGYIDKLVQDSTEYNKIMIYFNNKQQLEMLKQLLITNPYIAKYYKIITVHSDKDYVRDYMNYIKTTNDKIIVLTTKLIATGFDSDIDRVYFYSIKTNREELLQTIGRIRGQKAKITFVLTLEDILNYSDNDLIYQRFENIYDLLDIYYSIKQPKSELSDELKSITTEIHNKIANSNKTNQLTSQFTKFLLLEPFLYIRYSKNKSYPITMIRNIHFDTNKNKIKYKVTETVIDKMYRNLSVIDLPYEVIPKQIRKRYFAYDKSNFITAYLESYKNYPKKSDRFSLSYTNINKGSYRMMLDKLLVSLTLNSYKHNKDSITNKHLTKAERREIKIDYESDLHYFKTTKGYKVYPISLTQELINYLRYELPKLKLLDIQGNIDKYVDKKNNEFIETNPEDLKVFENFDEIIDAILSQKGFERVFISRSVMIYEHTYSKTVIILYANINKMFRTFSDNVSKYLYYKHLLNNIEVNENIGLKIANVYKKLLDKAYKRYDNITNCSSTTISAEIKYNENNISNREVKLQKSIGNKKCIYEFIENIVLTSIEDECSFLGNTMYIQPDIYRKTNRETVDTYLIILQRELEDNTLLERRIRKFIEYLATRGNVLDYVDNSFFTYQKVKDNKAIKIPSKYNNKEEYKNFDSKEFAKVAPKEVLAAYIAYFNKQLFLEEYELRLTDLDNIFNDKDKVTETFTLLFEMLILPFVNVRLLKLYAYRTMKQVFVNKDLVDNIFMVIQDTLSSELFVREIKQRLTFKVFEAIKGELDELINDNIESISDDAEGYVISILEYILVKVNPTFKVNGTVVKYIDIPDKERSSYDFYLKLLYNSVEKFIDNIFTENFITVDNGNTGYDKVNTFFQYDFILDIEYSLASDMINEIFGVIEEVHAKAA